MEMFEVMIVYKWLCLFVFLQFNGVDFRSLTREQAELEVTKPTESVSVLVQNNATSK